MIWRPKWLRRWLALHVFTWMFPGTLWEMDLKHGVGHGRCLHCGQDYNHHGDTWAWKRLTFPKGTEHLVCQPLRWHRRWSMSVFA